MKYSYLALISLFFVLPLLASDGHNHEAAIEPAPHGGILRDAKPYKAELVLNGDEASVYIYDSSLKPAPLTTQSLKGSIRLPKQKKESQVTFNKSGDVFKSVLKGVSKVHRFDLHIYLIEAGQKTVLDFGIDNIH